jgi:hypothetical protein
MRLTRPGGDPKAGLSRCGRTGPSQGAAPDFFLYESGLIFALMHPSVHPTRSAPRLKLRCVTCGAAAGRFCAGRAPWRVFPTQTDPRRPPHHGGAEITPPPPTTPLRPTGPGTRLWGAPARLATRCRRDRAWPPFFSAGPPRGAPTHQNAATRRVSRSSAPFGACRPRFLQNWGPQGRQRHRLPSAFLGPNAHKMPPWLVALWLSPSWSQT